MLLFPNCTLKKIQHDVVELPSQYWLDLVVSFDHQNTQDSQLDLPITPKASRFRAFLKVTGPIETESFTNAKFKVARGSTCQSYKFTLVDLPCLNNDRIILHNILLREKDKDEPVMSHLQLMINSYIQEVGSMDVDIATVLKKKPRVVPKEAPKDLEKFKLEKIYKEGWCDNPKDPIM
ncbi:unnamed protein product [Lactuca saligna]|uniref:Uncharacterized protein n=1 Tax=Lactuca saligna TaxID=75948 RepID=A0AA36E3P4_LACSI|nr:unnamed protein product [Lactuca saligna]